MGGEPSKFLDVGCGNGLLLPFALACGCPAAAYRGIDVSSRMIALAEKAHSGAKFEGATFGSESWADLLAEGSGGEAAYDAIVFNGSLQFFADIKATLTQAASLL